MCQWKKKKKVWIWIKFKIVVVVWVIKQGSGCHEGLVRSLSSRFEEWVGWDSTAAPVLEQGERAGKSWGGQWFCFCLKWDCSEQSTWFPRKSGAMWASLGWLSIHWPPFRLEQKCPKTFLLAWQCAAHWSGSFRYCQMKTISVLVSQSAINGSQSCWKSRGAFQRGSAIGVWSVLVLKTMNFYCGQNFCHVNAQIPCLLVLTPQCVLQLQRLCWIINILL